jgi:PPK2 family polyphosphate:nucleotide phosphotransferase
MANHYAGRVKPGRNVRLKEFDPDDTGDFKNDKEARALLDSDVARLYELQEKLYADNRYSLLVVLQGMDASGKDGTIKHVMRGLNPQGVQVTSFKTPSDEERDHDFLWRIHRALPRRGNIGIFNRSHYEDVLIARVERLVTKDVWEKRYDEINRFEELLDDTRMVVVKFFLHISKDEQKERFEARLRDPAKRWKFSTGDLAVRKKWDDYQEAYEAALSQCSTSHAPWFIVPANKKWFRNMAVARTLVESLESLDLKYPEPEAGLENLVIE